MKQLILALLGCLTFSILSIHGMESGVKRQMITEQPSELPLPQELLQVQFRTAVRAGSAEVVKRILDDDHILFNIHIAALHPEPEMLPALRYFDDLPPLSASALHVAAALGHTDVALVLLDHNAAVDILDSNGMTPLMWAAQEGHLTMVKLLIQAGADEDIEAPIGHCDAFWIAYTAENEADVAQKPSIQEVVVYFVERGCSEDYILTKQYILENPKLVALVLDRGALVTWRQQFGDRRLQPSNQLI